MKFFGHPLHIMIIHFPTALLPMELVCYAIYYLYRDASFANAAFYAMAGAVLLGWLAIIFGAWDLVNIPAEKPQTMKIALLHGGINTLVITVYTVFAYSLFKNYPQLPDANFTLLVVKALLTGFLLFGNYFGGNLILKHKMGVEN